MRYARNFAPGRDLSADAGDLICATNARQQAQYKQKPHDSATNFQLPYQKAATFHIPTCPPAGAATIPQHFLRVVDSGSHWNFFFIPKGGSAHRRSGKIVQGISPQRRMDLSAHVAQQPPG